MLSAHLTARAASVLMGYGLSWRRAQHDTSMMGSHGLKPDIGAIASECDIMPVVLHVSLQAVLISIFQEGVVWQ